MIINGVSLVVEEPIKDMIGHKATEHGVSYGLTECGYDIRIKQNIEFEDGWHRIDKGRWQEGNFALGSSVEEFNMPRTLMGRVLNKSTWARRGLDASMTTNIEPGWNGFLTIELLYHRRENLFIPAGSGICQIIFETLKHPAQYHGKYQDQKDEPVNAILGQPS